MRAANPDLRRVVVVGNSGSGKTALARRLAARLEAPHVELDALYWGPRWVARPLGDFRRDAELAASGERWVVDGNYRSVRDLVWPRATMLVWLDYALRIVFRRTLARTLRRWRKREALWAGNRETLARALWSHDSILLWVITSHRRRRADYRRLMLGAAFPQLAWTVLRSPSEAEAWLAEVGSDEFGELWSAPSRLDPT